MERSAALRLQGACAHFGAVPPMLRCALIHRRRTVPVAWNVAALRWAAIQVYALSHGDDHVVMSRPVYYSCRARQGVLLL